jgi:hypothetical protein
MSDKRQAQGPKREAAQLPDGRYRVTIAPPGEYEVAPGTMELSAADYAAYCAWLESGGEIQAYLPGLSDAERELLLSGLTPETYAQVFGGGPE